MTLTSVPAASVRVSHHFRRNELRHRGCFEAEELIVKGMEGAITAKRVTYDLERLMEGATLRSCSAFAEAMIEQM